MPNTPHGFRATTDWLMQNRLIPDSTHKVVLAATPAVRRDKPDKPAGGPDRLRAGVAPHKRDPPEYLTKGDRR